MGKECFLTATVEAPDAAGELEPEPELAAVRNSPAVVEASHIHPGDSVQAAPSLWIPFPPSHDFEDDNRSSTHSRLHQASRGTRMCGVFDALRRRRSGGESLGPRVAARRPQGEYWRMIGSGLDRVSSRFRAL